MRYGFRVNPNLKAIPMNDKVENLFSPEKLEKRWQRPSRQGGGADDQWQARMATASVLDAFTTLSESIRDSAKGERRQKVISAMLTEIRAGLEEVYGRDAEASGRESEVFAIITGIQKVEDLLEAYLGDQGDL